LAFNENAQECSELSQVVHITDKVAIGDINRKISSGFQRSASDIKGVISIISCFGRYIFVTKKRKLPVQIKSERTLFKVTLNKIHPVVFLLFIRFVIKIIFI
jgi:hypothetical protein